MLSTIKIKNNRGIILLYSIRTLGRIIIQYESKVKSYWSDSGLAAKATLSAYPHICKNNFQVTSFARVSLKRKFLNSGTKTNVKRIIIADFSGRQGPLDHDPTNTIVH